MELIFKSSNLYLQRTFGMCVININLRKVIFKYSLQPQIQKVVENDFYYFLRNFD